MKTNLLKVIMVILFISFNILCVFVYSYLTNKYQNKYDATYDAMDSIESEMLNDIKINEELLSEKTKSFKLVKINNSKYDLVDMNYNLSDVFDLFDDENEDKLDRMIEYSNKDLSKVYLDDEIYNYIDILGIKHDDEVKYIEIYDKEKVFNSKILLSSYNSIKAFLGDGTLFINHGDMFDYYIYAYKYKNLYIEFISFYEDGSNNICVIREDI